mmetsp:Transcript_35294/g.77302  ORF Transcript_35294/g.77302 Transcript_35294/m.77302 type:complete len:325 (+) Transcript_35294:46-1020(+)
MSLYGGYRSSGWGGYGERSYRDYGYDAEYDEYSGGDITFIRPDGTTEGKSIGWCKSNDFFEIEAGIWSGPWYYRLHPDQHPDRRFPHVCPVGGCRSRYATEEELDRHVRTGRGKAHDIYRDSNGIRFGPTKVEQEEAKRIMEERRVARIEDERAELLDELYGGVELFRGREEQIRKRLKEVEVERARILGYEVVEDKSKVGGKKTKKKTKKKKASGASKKKRRKEAAERRRKEWESRKKDRLEREKERARLRDIELKYRATNSKPPPHQDEGSKSLEPDGKFEVKSGGICFGLRHNCAYAATLTPAPFSEAKAIHYNHKASNGT